MVAALRTFFCAVVLVTCTVLAGVGTAGAQQVVNDGEPGIVERVRNAFSQGDATALLRDCSDQIEIGLFGSSVLYSRPQATYVLQSFFREFPPARFTVENSDRAAEDLFMSGRYWFRRAEQPLDVFMRFRRRGTHHEVREVRVERAQP